MWLGIARRIDFHFTYHGRVVAMLVPVEPATSHEQEAQAWAELDELAARIGRQWPQDVLASQAIAEGRR
ncbi:MAG: hypothetical protein JXB15_10600 [Anaerolineales bacterium]|nr:hypothetical protein [Anaerolineales bacterium]